MLKRFRTNVEESDLFLCFGIEALFFGVYLVYPPAAYILTGVVFTGLAYLSAPSMEVSNGVA